MQNLKQKFLVKKVDYLSKVGDKIQILGRTVERTRLGYRIITSRRYIDQSLKDMDMEKCNPVSTPGLQVTAKDLATEEQLPELLAGLYRRVRSRLLNVAGQRPDVQQAVKELARGMSSPTNSHWARLKRVMRYLVNKRTSIWKFEPTANEARDNELTATRDSDWGGCVKTRKSTTGIVLRYAGCTTATISRTQGCISLSSAEAEYYGMVSALAEAKQIQEILSEYHEDTHIILETDSSAAKANAERPGCGKMKHISVQYLDTGRSLMHSREDERSSDAGSPGRQSKCWTQEHREGLQRQQEHREGLPRKQEHREGLPRKWQREHCEGLPRKLAPEHRDGLPRKLAQEDRDWHKNIVIDGRENWHKKIMMDFRENWGCRKNVMDCRGNMHKNIVMDGRENWHKKIVMDGREQSQNSTRGAQGVNPSTGHTNILMDCSEI